MFCNWRPPAEGCPTRKFDVYSPVNIVIAARRTGTLSDPSRSAIHHRKLFDKTNISNSINRHQSHQCPRPLKTALSFKLNGLFNNLFPSAGYYVNRIDQLLVRFFFFFCWRLLNWGFMIVIVLWGKDLADLNCLTWGKSALILFFSSVPFLADFFLVFITDHRDHRH